MQQYHRAGVCQQSCESTGGGCGDTHHHDILVMTRDVGRGVIMRDVCEKGDVTRLGVIHLLGQGHQLVVAVNTRIVLL